MEKRITNFEAIVKFIRNIVTIIVTSITWRLRGLVFLLYIFFFNWFKDSLLVMLRLEWICSLVINVFLLTMLHIIVGLFCS